MLRTRLYQGNVTYASRAPVLKSMAMTKVDIAQKTTHYPCVPDSLDFYLGIILSIRLLINCTALLKNSILAKPAPPAPKNEWLSNAEM